MNNQPVLFFSPRCSHSKQIIDTLKAMNKETLCRMFSIEGKQRHELPPFLKSVPTLYIPDSKDIYIGKDIYSYIAKPVQARREIPAAQEPQRVQSQGAPPATGDFSAWSFEGSTGLTDAYSSWDAPGKYNTDDQLQYSFLNGPAPAAAPNKPEPKTKQSYDGEKNGRNEDISSRLEEYKKVRESEFKGVARQ